MGLEPTTSSLGSWHSTIELRPLTSNDNSNAEGSGQSNHGKLMRYRCATPAQVEVKKIN